MYKGASLHPPCSPYREFAFTDPEALVPPFPFNLGPNGSLWLLIGMEAPLVAAAVVKVLFDAS